MNHLYCCPLLGICPSPCLHSCAHLLSLCLSLYFSLCQCLHCRHTHTHTHTYTFFYISVLFSSPSLCGPLYSSCLQHPVKLHFVFNIVEFPECSGRPAGRRGLCTGGLTDLISPMLGLPGSAESSSKVALPKVMSILEQADFAKLGTLG